MLLMIKIVVVMKKKMMMTFNMFEYSDNLSSMEASKIGIPQNHPNLDKSSNET